MRIPVRTSSRTHCEGQSFEIDLSTPHFRARGKEWIEIAGCGMVDPNVFKAVGYPDDEYTRNWAFGFGIETSTAMVMWVHQ